MIIPEPWRDLYAMLKEALLTERNRAARDKLRCAIAALESGAMGRRAQAIFRTFQSGALEMPAIDMLEIGYSDAPTVALLRWDRFFARIDEEIAQRLAATVLGKENTLPADPLTYFSMTVRDA